MDSLGLGVGACLCRLGRLDAGAAAELVGLLGGSCIIDDVDLVPDNDRCVCVRVMLLLWVDRAASTQLRRRRGLQRLILHILIPLGVVHLFARLRCDGRRPHMVLVLQGERVLAERVELG